MKPKDVIIITTDEDGFVSNVELSNPDAIVVIHNLARKEIYRKKAVNFTFRSALSLLNDAGEYGGSTASDELRCTLME